MRMRVSLTCHKRIYRQKSERFAQCYVLEHITDGARVEGPNNQSGTRSPLKRLPESREEAAFLEPVLRACLLPLAAPGAQRSQTTPKPFWGARKQFMEPFSWTI